MEIGEDLDQEDDPRIQFRQITSVRILPAKKPATTSGRMHSRMS
jgi:hypothetical protein